MTAGVVAADRLLTTRPRRGAFATLVKLDLRLVILGAAILVGLIPGLTAIVV